MWVSFILNCAIVIMVIFSFCAMFLGWNFMGKPGGLALPGFGMLRFFTIDSNVLMGVCSLIMAGGQLSVLLGKTEELAAVFYVVKFMGVSAVMLTFLVTVCFLAPQFEDSLELFYNSNLFLHLITPLTAVISFVFTEHTDAVSFGMTFLGMVPILLYAVFYIVNVFTHLKDGKVDKKYDFYNFLDGKAERTPAAIVVILLVSYMISLLLWWGNRCM